MEVRVAILLRSAVASGFTAKTDCETHSDSNRHRVLELREVSWKTSKFQTTFDLVGWLKAELIWHSCLTHLDDLAY
jgi:hypothetical protein